MDTDDAWRRPPHGAASGDSASNDSAMGGSGMGGLGRGRPQGPAPVTYTPPPRTQPPPAGVPRGPLLVPVSPPPQPPEQDHAALDEIARQSRVVTIAVGAVAGVLSAVLLLLVVIRSAAS